MMRPTDAQHRAALAGHAERLRRYLAGELPETSWAPIRLGYGLYFQLDHTSHMQRIKLPAGLMTAEQVETLADVAERWGRGIAHVTTRQDLQIHWVPVGEIMEMYDRLLAVGITTRGACADSVRNVTACPYAGLTPDEPFDVTPYALAIHEYFLFNPLNLTLPRKFKIAVEGCPRDCAQVPINDIGYYAKVRDGARGFAVWAGGGLGAQPYLAIPIAEFVPADDLLIWSEAIVRVQHRHAERANRKRSRMKYVVKRLGEARFRELVEAQVASVEAERGDALRAECREIVSEYRLPAPPPAPPVAAPERDTFARWRRTNVRPERVPDRWSVDVRVPLGDLTSAELREIAALARTYANGTVRTTNDQNVVLPSVATTALPALHAALEDIGLGDPDAHTITDVVSCPGMDYCSLAITRSMGVAERIRTALMQDPSTGNGFAADLGEFSIKISGCPNSCGQHHVGHIGLTGHNVKEADGVERPYYSILAGGSVGEGTARIGVRVGRFREEQTPGAIAALAKLYAAEREPGEDFAAFAVRLGRDRLSAAAEAGATGT